MRTQYFAQTQMRARRLRKFVIVYSEGVAETLELLEIVARATPNIFMPCVTEVLYLLRHLLPDEARITIEGARKKCSRT